MVTLVSSVIGFVVSLLVGALGIYVGARIVVDVRDYSYALVTALVGSLVWFVVAFFIPFIGGLLALLAYLWLVNRRYPGGWGSAIAITLVAYLASAAVLYLLAVVGITSFEALGVPGL